MNKRFVREVLQLLPGFAVAGKNFFYERSFDHILAGFGWEASRSLYVWKLAFPLFDDAGFLHLGYGSRLPSPAESMPLEKGHERKMAEDFVTRIAPYREATSRLRELDCFVEYLQSREAGFANPAIREGYALALVMQGQDRKAIEQLELVIQSARGHELENGANKWIAAINAGVAREKLLSNEQQIMHQLGIEG
jgi:hypothetical protein